MYGNANIGFCYLTFYIGKFQAAYFIFYNLSMTCTLLDNVNLVLVLKWLTD